MSRERSDDLPVIAVDLPVLYEDEGYEEMGESRPHLTALTILLFGIAAHLEIRPGYQVLGDLNLYYHPRKRRASCRRSWRAWPTTFRRQTKASCRR